MYFNITCVIRPNPRLDALAFVDLLSRWFTRVTSCPSSFKICFVTIPSEIPVVRACNSASAELKLCDCCVLDHVERVALHHCVTPPVVLLHVCCCLAQSLSVYTFANCGNVLISIKHFALWTPYKCCAMRFTFFSSLSEGQVIFLAVSFTLYMMSARSWQMCINFPTGVLYTARFSFSSWTSDSVVGGLFTIGVVTGRESSRPSTVITSRKNFGFAFDLTRANIHHSFSQSLCQKRKCDHPVAPFVPQCAS